MAVKASAQVSIVDISDAYNVILTSESYTFTGNTSGATSGLSCNTQVVAYCGNEQCETVTVGTITCPTGISATITNNKTKTPTITFKTTATVTSACQAMIPVTVDGVTINKKFSFAVAKTGSTGNGIKAVTEHYAVSSSNTATPTEWLDYVMVTNSVERYLWYYETITYTNGTSVDGKKRVIGTYGEKGDDFRWNLVKGSSMTNGTRLACDVIECMNDVDINAYENDGFHIITPSKGNDNNGIGFRYHDFSTLGIKPGDTLTFSCDIKGTSDTKKPFIRLHFQASGMTWYDSGHLESLDGQFTPTADFKRVSVTYTLPDKDVYKSKRMWLAIHGNYASDLYIRNIKLELGSPATPWSPHPDDLVGADGKGIKSTAVTYQASTSGTVIPTGTWQTSIPTVSAGQYLWTRTVITYTDDSKSTSYSVGRMGTNGTNGSAGRGIKSTAITYQAGSSGTTAPTGTWQTTVPATSASSPYLWTRTIITYTDDTTSTSYAVGSTLEGVSVGGRNLARKTSNEYNNPPYTDFNGADNKCSSLAHVYLKGLSVGDKVTARLVYKYANIVAVTGKAALVWIQGAGNITEWKSGIFVSSQPIVLSGSGETIIKYSFTIDSEMIKNQYWDVHIRHDGVQRGSVQWKEFKVEKGNIATDWTPAPEDGIASVDVEYYLSTSATALSGGSWSTAAPTWVNGKYMWSRTVTTDGAGNKTYSPNQNGVCIAGAKGETGAAGADGKGVTSIVEQYYRSTSATALSGGSWSEKYPGWESGKYIWTRSVITYTDKTTTTTAAVCVTGEKGEDGYSPTATVSKTGDTTTITIVDKTGTHTQTVKDGTNGTPGKDGTNGKTTYFHVKYSNDGGKTFTSNSGETVGSYIGTCTNYTEADPTTVDSYVWAKIKGEKGDGLDIKDTRATNESPNWYIKNYPKTTVMEFKECKVIGLSNVGTYCNLQTIVLWSDNTVGYPRQTAKIEGTGKEYWRVGISNTTWSSWIDPYGKSLEAAKTATNFMEFNSGTGLQIGDKTNGSWKGFRSRITSTAFEILNEAGVAVASYGRKLIQLGKDSVDAIIELCGGKGNIKYATPENNYIQQGLALDRGLVIESVDNIIIKPANKFFVNTELTDSTTDFVGRSSITPGSFQLNVWQSNKGSNIINASVGIEGNIEEGLNLEATGGKYDFLEAIRFNNISLLDWIYPVGSIYMSAKEGNPALLFGGTWVAWGAGRVPVGFNGSDGNFNSSEKTGGSKTINIQHNHGLSNARAAVGRADSSLSTMSYTSGGNPHNVYFDREFSYYGGISGGSKHATDTSLIYGNTNNGGSTAASVLQPYIVCYMWKRTA